MAYAEDIIGIAQETGASKCYLSLLGDLISGSIHQSIRIENKETLIEQIVGVSELIAAFIRRISQAFDEVIVTSTSGNHSRIELNAENALRTERLDDLIPWYCKAKLSELENIRFISTNVDPTISVLEILGNTFVAVHGDMDHDLKTSALKISQLIGKKIDYFVAGHMHVAECRIEDVGYIRNGAVVTGGDEYTSKKRLFGPATQVCMLVSEKGVEAIYPVKL